MAALVSNFDVADDVTSDRDRLRPESNDVISDLGMTLLLSDSRRRKHDDDVAILEQVEFDRKQYGDCCMRLKSKCPSAPPSV
jgi:hypothetical protein